MQVSIDPRDRETVQKRKVLEAELEGTYVLSYRNCEEASVDPIGSQTSLR